MNNIVIVQKYLSDNDRDAYIMVDYENHNDVLLSFIGKMMLTRKVFFVIPKDNRPYLIAHSIDSYYLKNTDYDVHIYHTYKEMLNLEKELFSSYKKVVMDVSENGLLPRVSTADYGSVDFIKNLGIEVYSSGDIRQLFSATYDEESHQLQRLACLSLLEAMKEAFDKIKEDVKTKGYSDEYQIQQHISHILKDQGLVFDEDCIVAVNANASNPHYAPNSKTHSKIKEGDVVLIDMWAKVDKPKAVYGDITWMGYVGKTVPEKIQERFMILRNAVDSGIEFLRENLPFRRVEGYELDDVVRKVVDDSGYGKFFTHRTGHSIYMDDSPHGPGANIDNYESYDTRELIPHTSFSLEPGIYAPDFGMRSETDIYVRENLTIEVIGSIQKKVVPILAKDNPDTCLFK